MKKSGFIYFISRIAGNGNRDLFMVRLGTSLLLAKFGLTGAAASFVGYFLKGVVGVLIEEGSFLIDISIDALKKGREIAEFKEMADAAYKYATAKVYDENEKQKIRKQYLDIISRVTRVGD